MSRFACRGAALATALALAVPGAALAQGAGDNQYQDPFAGDEQGEQGGGGGGGGGQSGSGGGGGGGGGSGSDGSELQNMPPGSTEAAAAQSATPPGELPRTGGDPALVALLGAGFILTGAGLRVRVRRPVA